MKSSVIDLTGIPTDWEIIPCGYFFKEKSIKNNFGEINLSVYRDYGVIPRDSRDDNHNRVSEDISNYKLVDKGDFVLNKMKCWMGSLGVSNYRGIVSPSYTVLEPKKEIHNQYFHYLLRSEKYRQIYESLSYGVRVGQWELRFHDFKVIPALYPKIKEQELISKYLDKKTQKIDSLIKKIEKKIEFLNEQKTALINQYVTKGLDPKLEMKDSGIDWIGEIPKNWELSKIKYLIKMDGFRSGPFGSTLITSELKEFGDWIVYSPENLRSENVLNQMYLPNSRKEELKKYLVREEDIVLPIVGSLNVSKVIKKNDPKGILNQRLCRLSLDSNKVNIELVSFLFKNSQLIMTQIDREKKGSILDHITKEIIFNFIIPLPALRREQDAIFQKLIHLSDNLEDQINKNLLKIRLLNEYRQSLISSVVTGKIRITEDMI